MMRNCICRKKLSMSISQRAAKQTLKFLFNPCDVRCKVSYIFYLAHAVLSWLMGALSCECFPFYTLFLIQFRSSRLKAWDQHTFLAFSSTISPHFHKSRLFIVKGWGCQFPPDCRRHQMNKGLIPPINIEIFGSLTRRPVIARLTRKTTRVLLMLLITQTAK